MSLQLCSVNALQDYLLQDAFVESFVTFPVISDFFCTVGGEYVASVGPGGRTESGFKG
jgi:hypothetical protein